MDPNGSQWILMHPKGSLQVPSNSPRIFGRFQTERFSVMLSFTLFNRIHFRKYPHFIGKVQVLLRIKATYSIQFRKKIADKSLNTFEKSYHLQNTQSPCTYLKLNQLFILHLCITFSLPLGFKYWFWRGKIRLLQVCSSRMLIGFTCL